MGIINQGLNEIMQLFENRAGKLGAVYGLKKIIEGEAWKEIKALGQELPNYDENGNPNWKAMEASFSYREGSLEETIIPWVKDSTTWLKLSSFEEGLKEVVEEAEEFQKSLPRSSAQFLNPSETWKITQDDIENGSATGRFHPRSGLIKDAEFAEKVLSGDYELHANSSPEVVEIT